MAARQPEFAGNGNTYEQFGKDLAVPRSVASVEAMGTDAGA